MKSVFDGYNYTLRFDRGEKLVESLLAFVREQKIKGGWIVGLGGLSEAELGYYNLGFKNYHWKKYQTLLELASLTGNIAWNGDELALHLHATVSDTDMNTYGGHFKEGIVSGTAEIFIHSWLAQEKLKREHDEDTGLNLLDL